MGDAGGRGGPPLTSAAAPRTVDAVRGAAQADQPVNGRLILDRSPTASLVGAVPMAFQTSTVTVPSGR